MSGRRREAIPKQLSREAGGSRAVFLPSAWAAAVGRAPPVPMIRYGDRNNPGPIAVLLGEPTSPHRFAFMIFTLSDHVVSPTGKKKTKARSMTLSRPTLGSLPPR
jgi:hypothetical protein